MTLHLHKNVLKLWQLTAAVVFTAVFLCLLFIDIGEFKIYLSVVLSLIFCVFEFVYLKRLFKAAKLEVKNGKIIYCFGVIFKRQYIFPFKRAVYLQIFKLPVVSVFGLYAVVIRGVGKSVLLPLLTYSQLTDFKAAVENYD